METERAGLMPRPLPLTWCEWNSGKKFPKAYGRFQDDGNLWVMAMHAFAAKTGLANKQLVDNIVMAIQTEKSAHGM